MQSKIKFFIFIIAAAFLFSGMAHKPKIFGINLKVDFGPATDPSSGRPAGKPAFEDTHFQIEKDTTAKEAVSQVYPVLSGKGCCSLREVIAIDGVSIDPMKNRWWVCELNGARKFSPQKKKLKSGDVVAWKYIQNAQ